MALTSALLSPGTTYTVRVQIRNKFGVSESLHVPVVTLLEPIKQLAETKVAPSALTVDKVPPNAIVGTVDQILLADAFSSASVAGLSAKEMLEEAKKRKMLEQKLQLIRAIAKGYC